MSIETIRAIKAGTYSRPAAEKKTVGIPRERPVKEEKKRKSLPKATKPIKKRSDKQIDIMKQLKKLYRPFLEGHDECEIKSAKCTGQVETVHHVKGRALSVVFNHKFWKRSCNACNLEVESKHAWALENGHKVSRHKIDTMTKEEIVQSTSKKHVKIYKISQLGLPKKEIAELVGTNAGHVFNVLKEYGLKPEKAAAADQA